MTTSGRVGGVIGLARHPSESWDRCPQALRLRHEIPAFAGMTSKLKSLHPRPTRPPGYFDGCPERSDLRCNRKEPYRICDRPPGHDRQCSALSTRRGNHAKRFLHRMATRIVGWGGWVKGERTIWLCQLGLDLFNQRLQIGPTPFSVD